ncbi:leucine-rich_repeat domain-containing protein [Hexamita inflata]|uniref:Leucine-rich repeat domain-containing protein n=1 Tax=Hexamita inflata TaxID=28002 RepID=A0AA86NUT8_9EUKA|nr:leucine-rich repeat domain-containing protein [Hexamita inflata]
MEINALNYDKMLKDQNNLRSEQKMTEKYRNVVVDGSLKIYNDTELTNLQFVQNFDVSSLQLNFCKNLIPKLNSNSIKELYITQCNTQSIEGFHLENLEVLELQDINGVVKHLSDEFNSGLLENIIKFKKLKHLSLNGYQNININSIMQIKENITKLQFITCGIKYINVLQHFSNLRELNLSNNKYINITPLQCLKELIVLDLSFCGLDNIQILKYLVRLQELHIQNNSISHIQPLKELNMLFKLNAENNRIIDIQSLEMHPNFNLFYLGFQNSHVEKLETENIREYLNRTGEYLNQMVNNAMFIQNDPKILVLKFIQHTEIKLLTLYQCQNVILELNSNTLINLKLCKCTISNFGIASLYFKLLHLLLKVSLVPKFKFSKIQQISLSTHQSAFLHLTWRFNMVSCLTLSLWRMTLISTAILASANLIDFKILLLEKY